MYLFQVYISIPIHIQYMYFRYIFPGLALGAALGQTGVVTDGMITKSAEVLRIRIFSGWD